MFPYGFGTVFTRLYQKDFVENGLYSVIEPNLSLTKIANELGITTAQLAIAWISSWGRGVPKNKNVSEQSIMLFAYFCIKNK